MDHASFKLNLHPAKKNQFYQHKEHLRIGKIAEFGCEISKNTENIAINTCKCGKVLPLPAYIG